MLYKLRTLSSRWHIPKEYRVNEKIRANKVRLIGEAGEQLGVVSFFDAMQAARSAGVDLVEVAPNADPPVCRLLDYGKLKYEQAKKEKEARKHQKNVMLREVRIRPKIGEHDVDLKAKTVQKLLNEGDKVKIAVMFRGREVTHPQLGRDLLERVYAAVKDVANVEQAPTMEGRRMSIILAPGAAKQVKPRREAKEE